MDIRKSLRKALKEQCFWNDNPPPALGDYGCMDSDAINFDPSATHPCNDINTQGMPMTQPSIDCADCDGNQDWCGPGTYPGDCCEYSDVIDDEVEEIPICPDGTINNPDNPACTVGMELEWFDTVNNEIFQGINPNFANNWL